MDKRINDEEHNQPPFGHKILENTLNFLKLLWNMCSTLDDAFLKKWSSCEAKDFLLFLSMHVGFHQILKMKRYIYISKEFFLFLHNTKLSLLNYYDVIFNNPIILTHWMELVMTTIKGYHPWMANQNQTLVVIQVDPKSISFEPHLHEFWWRDMWSISPFNLKYQ